MVKKAAKKGSKATKSQHNETKGAQLAVGTRISGAKKPVVLQSTGSFIVKHKEFFKDIYSGANSVATQHALNPQRAEMFPWLSAIASRFEMYRFRKLKFIYSPSTSTTNDAYVVIGFDFDAYDAAPSKGAMLAWRYASKTVVWQPTVLDVSADSRSSTWRYCDTEVRGDTRLDLLGKLAILCVGTTVSAVGELFVEYEVELKQPAFKLPPALYLTATKGAWGGSNKWFENLTIGVEILGNILASVDAADALIVKDAGKFLVNVGTTGSSISGGPTMDATAPSYAPDGVFSSIMKEYAYSTTAALTSYLLDVAVAPVYLTFTQATGTITSSSVRVATYKP